MIAFDKKKAIANHGNVNRLFKVYKKLEEGQSVTICFLGGSITQGSLSSAPDTCYAALVYKWFKDTFKKADIKYVNAGIGGTTSAFGAARVDMDVLSHNPDLVLFEFAVNDECDEYFMESYEGLLRKLLYNESAPAVATLFNMFYENGKSAERLHSKVARYYDIPACSLHGAIYDMILSGEIEEISVLSPDGLHPNDTGHELLSNVVINLFSTLYEEYKNHEISEDPYKDKKAPLTENAFESAIRLDNRNFNPILQGFKKDKSVQKEVSDCFKNGWLGKKQGDSIIFDLSGEFECTGIAIQYDKTIKRPAPIAEVIIDDDETTKVIIDTAFDETWGDLLDINQIFIHEKRSSHKLEIRIIDDKNTESVPFNLVSVIITG